MAMHIRTWTLSAFSALSLCCFFPGISRAHWQPPVINNNTYNSSSSKSNTVMVDNHQPSVIVVPANPSYGPSNLVSNQTNVVTNQAAVNQLVVINRTSPGGTLEQPIVLPRPGNALYVLSIGVNCNRVEPGKPADDHAPFAREIATLLRHNSKSLYGQVHARVLAGPHATRQSILDGFDWLRKNVTPGDVTVIFISSHGGYSHGRYLMAPAKDLTKDVNEQVVWGEEIRESLLEIPGRKVLFLNTCNAAGILNSPVRTRGLPNTEIICCVRANEGFGPAFALDNALVRGLKGAAVNRAGLVTLGSLEHYLETQVNAVTKNKEHVTIAHPMHIGANYGPAATSLVDLPLEIK